jgi:hypothetical protein
MSQHHSHNPLDRVLGQLKRTAQVPKRLGCSQSAFSPVGTKPPHLTGKSSGLGSQMDWEIKWTGKSNGLGSQMDWEVKWTGKSTGLGSPFFVGCIFKIQTQKKHNKKNNPYIFELFNGLFKMPPAKISHQTPTTHSITSSIIINTANKSPTEKPVTA